MDESLAIYELVQLGFFEVLVRLVLGFLMLLGMGAAVAALLCIFSRRLREKTNDDLRYWWRARRPIGKPPVH